MRIPQIAWQSKASRSHITYLKFHDYSYQSYTGMHISYMKIYCKSNDMFYDEL